MRRPAPGDSTALAAQLSSAVPGLLVAPHNWGSIIGYAMQLRVGRGITNFSRAEHDPLSKAKIRFNIRG